MKTGEFRVGCPVWACADWRGSLFRGDAQRKDFLSQYSQVFETVEGNSTFYALPTPVAVDRWRREVPERFRFCFKFPSDITHRKMLADAGKETTQFLRLMSPLESRLGPFLIQLGPKFDARQLGALRTFLAGLSHEFRYAVELRHPDWFDGGPFEAALHECLRQFDVDRAVMDTRCVHAAKPSDASTIAAQAKKPRVPLRRLAIGRRPMLRFVGENTASAAYDYLPQWIDAAVAWLAEGRDVYYFMHTPDDIEAPALSRWVHERVAQRAALPPLPAFPGAASAVQLGLW